MTDPFKLIILPATKAGMTRADLQHHLEFVHGPLVMKYPDVSGGFTEYVHHYVESRPEVQAGRDAVTIISFASVADLGPSKANENYQLHVGPDEDNFRDEAGSRAFSGVALVIRHGAQDRLGDAPRKLLIFRRLREGADAAAEWESHVTAVLGGGEWGVGRIVVNRLSPLGGPGDFDILDEIGLIDEADIKQIEAALDSAPAGLVAGTSIVLVTRPRVFV
jgi:EthD domain